jgi:hypothetical protein
MRFRAICAGTVSEPIDIQSKTRLVKEVTGYREAESGNQQDYFHECAKIWEH